MFGENPDYERLKQNSGIDFQALKQKYSNNSAGGLSGSANSFVEAEVSPKEEESFQRRDEARKAHEALNKYRTCDECFGTGIKKYVYNFISMESNCEICDGNGLIMKREYADMTEKEEVKSEIDVAADVIAAVGSEAVAAAVAATEPTHTKNMAEGGMESPD